jgi:DNA-binding CsgD family transcriptional regulator
MLTALLGTAHIQDELAALVLDKADGVLFFLEELVKALQETSAIGQVEGQWRLTARATGMPVPDTVEEVLMARIDRLTEGAKSFLQIGAVVGREVSGELLGEIAGLPEWELTTHLAVLTKAGLLYPRGLPPQTTYLFKHALTQEVAYRNLLTSRRRDLHHHVAVTLETLFTHRLEEYYGQLAHHYYEAAQKEGIAKALEYAMRAAERHMTLPAYAEAVRFYDMALQALERQEPVDAAQRCTLLLALGEAQRKAGEHVRALETLQSAAGNARQVGSVTDLVHVALEYEYTIWIAKLPAEPAVHLLEEALRALGEGVSILRARVLGSLARALLFTGVLEPAAACAQQAVEVARQVGDPGVLAFNLHVLLTFPWQPEETEERLAYATEMLHYAQKVNKDELVCNAHVWRMLLLLELGDIQAVDAALDGHAQAAHKFQAPVCLCVTAGYGSMRALLEGRFAEAERLVMDMYNLSQRMQGENLDGTFGLLMYTLRREQGRLHEVEPALRHFMQQQGAAAAWRPGLALLYSELGRRREARAELEHLARHDFADLPRDSLWMACMTYLTDVCASLGDAAHAATLYQLLLPYAGRTVVIGNATACYGAVSRYLGMLAATMKRWEEATQHFEDALAMNTRMGARPSLAHTQHKYANMLLARNQSGDRGEATALLNVALSTARELGMRALESRLTVREEQKSSPALTTPASLASLSQRELELLRLLATGKSNQEIADALFISLNTVATHVRNILTKTGCINRTEAAAYALRHGLHEG